MHQGILSWSTCRWRECRSACWRISGFSSCPSPSRTPAPAAPSSCPACRRSRTRSAPARPRRRRCSCRPSSWAGAEVGCTHREAADTGQSRMLLSYVPVFTGIPLLLTKWDMPGELRLLGHKKENEIMQLSSSFFLFFFFFLVIFFLVISCLLDTTQSQRKQGCLLKSSFVLSTRTRA